MSTSGDDPRLWVFYAALVVLTVVSASRASAGRGGRDRWSGWWPPPIAAVAVWAVVAMASLSRLLFPSLPGTFRRDPVRTRDEGEWWRVFSSALIQDGGVLDMIVALVFLAVVAAVSVRIWGWYRAVALLLVGQLLWGLFTTFVSPSVGAGTLGATLALAGSVAGLWPVVGARHRLLAAAAATFVLGAALVAFDDAHGVAVLIGMLLGAVLGTVLPPPRPTVPTAPMARRGAAS
ncbi:rhomboid family intramembrane serine protease [Rhodococcus chondri]|uniref:Rhomboid family intramembrane serine protease n=1 Tax=Rhodococcus chondri TaxID=3065941 RepID=A0ABU7JZT9_9NOCA|nr:rhomboid family intramembrane serine protease [Rhodococcus sp. CC-R104]MEE2035506.1 rhomboid family intramembrane serine protease [Rhodococcus sp. CC-R104]